jgi:hypothetical protein
LSMQPLHGRCTGRDTCYECQHHLGLRMHDTCPLSVEANRQAARFRRASMRRRMLMRDRKKLVFESMLADSTMAACSS